MTNTPEVMTARISSLASRARRSLPECPEGFYRVSVAILTAKGQPVSSYGSLKAVAWAECYSNALKIAAAHPSRRVVVTLTAPQRPSKTLTFEPAPKGATVVPGRLIGYMYAYSKRHNSIKAPKPLGSYPADEAIKYDYNALTVKQHGNHRGMLKGAADRLADYAQRHGITGPVAVAVTIHFSDSGIDHEEFQPVHRGQRTRWLLLDGKTFKLI